MFKFLQRKDEKLLLESLSKDTWLVTRGDGSCTNHFYVRRNGIELCISSAPRFGWLLFKATVNGREIRQYNSVKNKCVDLIKAKFGEEDVCSMIEKELSIRNDLLSS